MRQFINIVEAQTLREWANPDDLIAQSLSLTMQMCAAQGFRKGWDGQSEGGDDTEFRAWCEQRLREAYAEIAAYIRGDDSITIYRAITLPEGETPNTNRHPGICWTYDTGAIHPAHGHLGQHIWVFTAETSVDQIDWVQTLSQNATPGYVAEKEIRLKDHGRIDDLTVVDTGEVK